MPRSERLNVDLDAEIGAAARQWPRGDHDADVPPRDATGHDIEDVAGHATELTHRHDPQHR
jgi:hypothetical protein